MFEPEGEKVETAFWTQFGRSVEGSYVTYPGQRVSFNFEPQALSTGVGGEFRKM